jgi:hypothetical protein
LKGVVERPAPPSLVPRSKGTENWRSDASFWYLNETRTRCFSRAAKQNDKTGKKKKKSWGKKWHKTEEEE